MNRTSIFFILAIVMLSCSKPSDDANWSFIWTHQTSSHAATSANAYITQIDLGKGPNHIAASDSTLTRDYRISIYLTSSYPEILQ